MSITEFYSELYLSSLKDTLKGIRKLCPSVYDAEQDQVTVKIEPLNEGYKDCGREALVRKWNKGTQFLREHFCVLAVK